ncbi:hypothetical protein NKG94_04295 [Micromonospora sp. M12]
MRLSLGHAYITAGRQQLGVDHLSRAAELYHRLGDRQYQVVCVNALGMAALWIGQLDVAVQSFERIRELNVSPVSPFYEVAAGHGLGIACRYRGNLARSAQLLTEAAESGTQLGRDYSVIGIRLDLGGTYREQGRLVEALEQLLGTLAQFRALGSRLGEAGRRWRSPAPISTSATSISPGGSPRTGSRWLARSTTAGPRRRLSTRSPRVCGRNGTRRPRAAAPSRLDRWLSRSVTSTARSRLCSNWPPPNASWASCRRPGHVTEAEALVQRRGFWLHHGTVLRHLAAIQLDEGASTEAGQTCRQAIAVCERTGQRAGLAAAQALLDRIIAGASASADPRDR